MSKSSKSTGSSSSLLAVPEPPLSKQEAKFRVGDAVHAKRDDGSFEAATVASFNSRKGTYMVVFDSDDSKKERPLADVTAVPAAATSTPTTPVMRAKVSGGGGDSAAASTPATPTTPSAAAPLPFTHICRNVLEQLIQFKYKKRAVKDFFMEIPSQEDFPEYHEVIKRPISFQSVLDKVGHRRFRNFQHFYQDVLLIFANAKQYNEESSVIYKAAEATEAELNRIVEEEGHLAPASPPPAPAPAPAPIIKLKSPAAASKKRSRAEIEEEEQAEAEEEEEPSTLLKIKGPKGGKVVLKLNPVPESGEEHIKLKLSSGSKGEERRKSSSGTIKIKATSDAEDSPMAGASKIKLKMLPDAALTIRPPPRQVTIKATTSFAADTEAHEAISSTKDAILELGYGSRDILLLFREKPSRTQLPEYYAVIKNPISLKQIQVKIHDLKYGSYEEFEDDVLLMVTNAKIFNMPGSEVYEDANTILDVLMKHSPDAGMLMAKAASKLEDAQAALLLLDEKTDDHEAAPASESRPSKKRKVEKEAQQQQLDADFDDDKIVVDDGIPAVPFVELPNGKVLEPGTFVYTKGYDGGGGRSMVVVTKILEHEGGSQPPKYFLGQLMLTPDKTFHVQTKKFYPQEVFRSKSLSTFAIEDICGFFHVLSHKDYISGRLEGVKDEDTWLCEDRYNNNSKSFKRLKDWKSAFPIPVKSPVPRIIPYPEGPKPLAQVPSPFYNPATVTLPAGPASSALSSPSPFSQSSSTKFKFSGGKPIKTSSMNTFSPSTGSPSSPFPRPNQTPPPSNLFQLRALVHNGIAVHQRQMDAFVNLSQLLTSLQLGPDKEAEVLDYIVTNGRARGSSIQDWGHQSSPLLLGIWVHPTPLMTLLQEVDLKPLEVGNVLAVFDPLFSFRPQTAAMPSTSVKLLSKQSSLSKQKSNIYGQTTQRPMPPPPPPPPKFVADRDLNAPVVLPNSIIHNTRALLISNLSLALDDGSFSVDLPPHDDVAMQVDITNLCNLVLHITPTSTCGTIRLLANGQLVQPRSGDDDVDVNGDGDDAMDIDAHDSKRLVYSLRQPPPGTLVLEIETVSKIALPSSLLPPWDRTTAKASTSNTSSTPASSSSGPSSKSSSAKAASSSADAPAASRPHPIHRAVQTLFLQLVAYEQQQQ